MSSGNISLKMLIITEIIPHIKNCLDQFSKWNPYPMQFPYKVHYYNDNDPKLIFSSPGNSIAYEFEALTPSKQWIWHVLILSSGITSTLYQSIYEDKLPVEVLTHAMLAMAFMVFATLAYIQHFQAKDFANFLNELMRFEKRRLAVNSEAEQKFWRNIEYRDLIVLGINGNRTSFTVLILAFATSVAVFPFCPWRLIPATILKQLDLIFGNGVRGGFILADVTRRLVGCVYSYVVMSLSCNRVLIVLSMCFFASQSSLVYMLVALKRHLKANAEHFAGHSRKVDFIVGIYREIQLLCGLHNHLHKMTLMPVTIINTISVFSVSFFILMSRKITTDFLTTLIFGNCVLLAIGIMLLIFHLCVKLYLESQDILMMQQDLVFEGPNFQRQSKLAKKYWRSFTVFKVFFFETNYFDGSTPLVILDFALDCVINLILCET